MTIGGREYTSDLIICNRQVHDNWWRKTSHKLSLEDIKAFLYNTPEVLVVGNGKFGLMKVQKDLINYCESSSIELIVQKSEVASETYNELVNRRKHILAAFHLTC